MVETTSMNAANSSATRVMPNGAVQPPMCITIGPVSDDLQQHHQFDDQLDGQRGDRDRPLDPRVGGSRPG